MFFFCNNDIDVYGVREIVLIQAVGTALTSYLMKNVIVDVYYIVELDHIKFLASLYELWIHRRYW